MVNSMTRIEKHLPIPSAQIEDIPIDLSDITARERAGEFDEKPKKPKKEKVLAKRVKQENTEDSELDIASLVSTSVPEFELIENPTKFYVINFTDITRSHRINPLNPKYIKNQIYAKEFAEAIINSLQKGQNYNDKFFTPSASLTEAPPNLNIFMSSIRIYFKNCFIPFSSMCTTRQSAKTLAPDFS